MHFSLSQIIEFAPLHLVFMIQQYTILTLYKVDPRLENCSISNTIFYLYLMWISRVFASGYCICMWVANIFMYFFFCTSKACSVLLFCRKRNRKFGCMYVLEWNWIYDNNHTLPVTAMFTPDFISTIDALNTHMGLACIRDEIF